MNKKTLGNLVTALRDAQEIPVYVALFTWEAWGFPIAGDEQLEMLEEAFPTPGEEEPDYFNGEINYDNLLDHIAASIEYLPHNCGAPACALGHYALRDDLQDIFLLDKEGCLKVHNEIGYMRTIQGITDERIQKHFSINATEAIRLFSSNGCGGAETPGEAADYIENVFMKRSKGYDRDEDESESQDDMV